MVALSLVLLLIPNAVALYDHSLYAVGIGSPLTAVSASFKSDTQDCEIRMESFTTLNKGTMPITTSIAYHSPGDSVLVTGSRIFSSNVTCASYGVANTTQVSANDTLEGKSVLTHDADTAALFLTDKYVCSGNDDFTNITVNRTTADSRDLVTNLYIHQKTKNCVAVVPYTVSEFTPELDSTSNWGECKSLSVTTFDKDGISLSKGEDECYGMMYYIPVNSSINGDIIYDLDCTNCMTLTSSTWSTIDDQRWIIYPSDTPASITTLAAAVTASGSINVNPDEEYVIAYFFAAKRTTPPFTVEFDMNPPDNAEIDIFSFTPDYVCGEWSECINSTQHRLCIDSFGKASDRFEYRACSITVLQSATLGFEESENVDDVKKCQPDWVLGCSHSITSISVERPLNWTILDPSAANKQNFLSMTQEWASEGTRSLKMWYIPPREGEPSGGICVNLTEGRVPQILQNISNSTFATIFNVTFPAENMLFSFDIKGCAEQVLHHSELRTLFDLVLLCTKACYGENCSITPLHRYFFNIIDTSDDTSLLGSPYFGNADTDLAETISIDLTNLGVVPGRDYTLVFAVFPENLNDRTGDCVMFDNVRYEVIAEPLDSLIPGCESTCIGDDFYVARVLPNGQCSVMINEFSPSCTDSAKAGFIENLEDYCIDTTTAAIFNEIAAKYFEVVCDIECSGGRCITEEEAAEETIEDFQDTTDIEGMIAALTSKFAIGFYIISILSGIAGAATKQWQIGSITAIGALFLVVFGGLWPLEIGFVVAAFILILFAAVGTNAVLGKAGG